MFHSFLYVYQRVCYTWKFINNLHVMIFHGFLENVHLVA